MKDLPDIDRFTIQHLPIVTAYAQKIGVVETINTLIPTQMKVNAGTIILGTVLDTLTGKNPLYRLNKYFEHQDTQLLLDKKVDSKKFSDHTVGRVLDRIHLPLSISIENTKNKIALIPHRIKSTTKAVDDDF